MISKPLTILLIFALLYLIWALLHHKKDKSLTLPIFLEYVLTATLALILLTGVIR